jgi:hypothetical protein
LILAPGSGRGWRGRFHAVLAPFSTVYRNRRQPENAILPGSCRIDLRKRRLKTAEADESAAEILVA